MKKDDFINKDDITPCWFVIYSTLKNFVKLNVDKFCENLPGLKDFRTVVLD